MFLSSTPTAKKGMVLPEAALKTAYHAAFLSDDTAVFVVTQRRIKRFDITQQPSGLRVRQAWSTAITHGSSVLLSADETVLMTTDTSGAHYGLSVATGEILWTTRPIGEGSSGVILGDGSFLFVSWRGTVQHLNPKSGQEVTPSRHLGGHMYTGLQVADDGSLTIIESLRPASDHLPVSRRLCRMDWPSMNYDILQGELDHGAQVAISPDGSRVALSGPDNSIRVRHLRSQEKELRQELPGPAYYNCKPVWSGDSQNIAVVFAKGHALFRAGTLQLTTVSNSPYPNPAVFSPYAKLAVLCDWENAKLVQNA